ncbi:ATP-binding protein [Candidatus Peregrinibacteria bacterium]|nr:ATP-binding protein [Candidatus Peregrinibacteria bacterium]
MYIPRYLEDVILGIHKTFKVLYLGGPRQVGKTTLLLKIAEKTGMNYVSLDDLSVRALAKGDPDLFLQKYSAPLLIDEVQYAPELFPYIKIRVDKNAKNGLYWLTGSQQFSIMKNVKESLAGRIGIVNLLGFSLAEEKRLPKTKNAFLPGNKIKNHIVTGFNDIFNRIFRGSFPILALKNRPSLETFYNSYLQTYIDRDLRDIFNVSKISVFHTFLQLCAARTGQILNYADLARDANISVNAAQQWIAILENSMQIYILRPYYKNISKRLIKSPKIYFLDTGLAAFLTKWKTPQAISSGSMAGAFFETFAVSEIIKSYLFRGQEPPLYYFRDKEGHEVDLLIERNNKLYPVEIKLAAQINNTHLKNIIYLRNNGVCTGKGAVVCLAREELPISRLDSIMPVGVIS